MEPNSAARKVLSRDIWYQKTKCTYCACRAFKNAYFPILEHLVHGAHKGLLYAIGSVWMVKIPRLSPHVWSLLLLPILIKYHSSYVGRILHQTRSFQPGKASPKAYIRKQELAAGSHFYPLGEEALLGSFISMWHSLTMGSLASCWANHTPGNACLIFTGCKHCLLLNLI